MDVIISKIRNSFCIIVALFLSISSALAADPSLSIKFGTQTKNYTRSELLNRADLTTITIPNDPFYNKQMTYKAIPAAAFFTGLSIPSDSTIQFLALDGFSAALPKDKLLNSNPNNAIAYLAVKPTSGEWPAVNPGVDNRTAAPFYLVWLHPEKSQISTEEWPIQVISFEIKESFAKQFPHVMPEASMDANDPIMLGFKVFKTNCMTCHTINREGTGTIGPDLNVPYNPTEYIGAEYLRMFIRNTQSLRHYPQDRMTPFPPSIISDQDLDNLIAYLTYMKDRKVSSK